MTGRIWSVAATAVVAAAVTTSALAGQFVVIASTASSLAPGAVVADAQEVTLSAGASVTVVDPAGAVLTLVGPYSGAIGSATGTSGGSFGAAMAKLISGQGTHSAAIGAMRGDAREGPPSPWLINAARSGAQCAPAKEAALWRARDTHAAKLTIIVNGRRSTIQWPRGSSELEWPTSVPLTDGTTYKLRLGSRIVRVKLNIAAQPFESDKMAIAWMAARGCRTQARALLSRLGNSDS